MDFSISKACGWRNLASVVLGEFWIDRKALTLRMSQMSETQRTSHRWGIDNEFNEGLDEILRPNQAVGQMREDRSVQLSPPSPPAQSTRSQS